jgi:tetratricopeptide (TPR) repeat protein
VRPLSENLTIKDLLLPPRSCSDARVCTVGEPVSVSATDTGVVTLSVRRGDPASFASLVSVCSELCQLSNGSASSQALSVIWAGVEQLRRAEQALAAQPTLDSAALASRGALAALRRVTRESAEVAIITDRAARMLAQILVRPLVQRVVVRFADEIDRPSLKVLARACLIARPENCPVWEWCFSVAPDRATDSSGTIRLNELERAVRLDMLRTIFAALRLTPRAGSEGRLTDRHAYPPSFANAGVGLACAWLSTQNYDAAIRWAVEALGSERNIDALRLLAVAATNTGRHDLAIRAFNDAYHASRKSTLRAHLCSMQALIIAKRKFDLAMSQEWYERGLKELALVTPDDDGDAAIEEAWIYNGLALNALLEARFSGQPIGVAFEATFKLLCRAFELVEKGTSPDHIYLRYNLLGNMSAFMDIQGHHSLARDLFERAFDTSLTEGLADALEWEAVLTTRRAGLCANAGETETALRLYRDATGMLVKTDRMACAETVQRSVGILMLRLGRPGEAEPVFREGLDRALQARSLLGAKVHGAGLVNALVSQGRVSAAADALLELGHAEGVWLSDQEGDPKIAAQSVAAPKRLFGLSTSIPEIDLECLEPVRISEVLSYSETMVHAAA